MRSTLVALALPFATLPAQDWRGFRGTDARATSAAAAPLEWDAKTHLAWQRPLPGPGASSPIVVGDAVFVTCWSGYGLDRKQPGDPKKLRRHLFKVAAATGKVVWQRSIAPVESEDAFGGRMATHGYASSTPVSDGKNVYVFFGKSGVLAFDLDGKPLWTTDVGKKSSKWKTGSGTSLSLWEDLLFVNACDESASLRALRRKDGKEVWQRGDKAFDQAYTMPLVVQADSERPQLLYAMLGAIWGLDPRTGKTLWELTTKTNGALAPCLIADDETVYSWGGQIGNKSHAVQLGGKGDVTKTHLRWATRYGSYVTTPLLVGDHIFWVNEGGICYCADKKTGELAFKERLEGTFYASPVRAGDAIYFVSRGAGTFVIKAAPKFELLHHNRIESDDTDFDGTPAISGGRIFLRSRKALYCVK